MGKGAKPATIPLVPRTARTIDLAAGERYEGPELHVETVSAWTVEPADDRKRHLGTGRNAPDHSGAGVRLWKCRRSRR